MTVQHEFLFECYLALYIRLTMHQMTVYHPALSCEKIRRVVCGILDRDRVTATAKSLYYTQYMQQTFDHCQKA